MTTEERTHTADPFPWEIVIPAAVFALAGFFLGYLVFGGGQ